MPFLKTADLDTGGAMTLPRRFYMAPEAFELERDRLFSRHWLCTAREESIPRVGDFVVRTFGNESVIILRDTGGGIRHLHNVCRHRGTRLCEAESGSFSRRIQCPYHAWTYSLDGTLASAPGMDRTPGFDKGDYPLHEAPLANLEGLLFISLSEPPGPFELQFGGLRPRLQDYGLANLRRVRQINYDVAANWKLIFENYSECYHCPTIHPALARLTPFDSGANDYTQGPILGGYMELAAGSEGMTESGRACSMAVGELRDDDQRRIYYYSIFPNALVSLHRDYVMVHTLWPVSPERTLIECDWLFHPDAASQPGYDPEDGIRFWDTTNRQDWHICEQSQRGIASRAYTPGPFTPRDTLSAAFDREYLRALGVDRGDE